MNYSSGQIKGMKKDKKDKLIINERERKRRVKQDADEFAKVVTGWING